MIEFKLKDFFYPADLARTYWLLRRSEHWTPEQFTRYQDQKLARLLTHCSTQAPYYRACFRDARITVRDGDAVRPEDARALLARLPILDKDTLRSQPEQFRAANAARFHPKPVSTSGTTGTPLQVTWDRSSNVMEFCSIQRLWRWAGFRIGQPFLDLRSRALPHSGRYLVEEDGIRYIRNPKINQLDFSSDLIDDGNIERYYAVLLRYRPRLVRGHPQAIEYLANLLHAHGLDGWRPAAVTTASETLYDFQRRAISEAWGVPVLDSYGLIEHNVFIAQCPAGTYHVSPEYGICEIVDDAGRAVGPGEEGWIVATGLHNYAQPLLRYNTRDRAIVGDGRPCACGRTLPAVERIVGRIDDCVVAANGKRYSGFSFAFFDRPGLKMARLVQQDYDRVTVEVVADTAFDGQTQAALLADLERKVDGALHFQIQPVERIVQETPGKFKFVVSRVAGGRTAASETPAEAARA